MMGLGVGGGGGGGGGNATARCGEMPRQRVSPHRAVGMIERGCLIPKFVSWDRAVQGEGGLGGTMGTRFGGGGGGKEPGRGKASITRCLPEQANSAQN